MDAPLACPSVVVLDVAVATVETYGLCAVVGVATVAAVNGLYGLVVVFVVEDGLDAVFVAVVEMHTFETVVTIETHGFCDVVAELVFVVVVEIGFVVVVAELGFVVEIGDVLVELAVVTGGVVVELAGVVVELVGVFVVEVVDVVCLDVATDVRLGDSGSTENVTVRGVVDTLSTCPSVLVMVILGLCTSTTTAEVVDVADVVVVDVAVVGVVSGAFVVA